MKIIIIKKLKMEIKVKKIEDLMTSNLMDIISGSYKFKKNEKKE